MVTLNFFSKNVVFNDVSKKVITMYYNVYITPRLRLESKLFVIQYK